MKLGLIIFSVVIGLFLGTGYALATTGTPAAAPVAIPAVEPGYSNDVTAVIPAVFQVPEVVVHGSVPAKHAHVAPKKHWVCGEMYDNAVGGRNSDCFWK